MRITTHILETLLIGITFIPMLLRILPFFHITPPPLIFFFIFFGLFCGAMYPDTDCPKSRIFKMKQERRKIGWQSSYQEWRNKKNAQRIYNFFLFVFSSILITLGYIFRFLIYFPSFWIVYLINKKYIKEYEVIDEHRGISHTFFGITIATGLFFLLFFLVNLYFSFTGTNYLFVSTITFFLAGNIHLLQDSISKSGIKWFYPFKEKHISGNYTAFVEFDPRIIILNLFLIGTLVLIYFVRYYISNNFPNTGFKMILGVSIISLLPFICLFLIFYFLFRSCQVKITNN
ncbi:MAG: metal-dependent hydrolase [archaeon]